MSNEDKMNVLVIGSSGVGKSTLINSLSDVEVISGSGEGVTQNITIYESNNWPIKFIDTKGFEYNIFEQIKTINQIKKYSKKQIKDDKDSGIDVVWYCIDGTSKRNFSYNIELMNKAIKGWKNIPIFVVITKSYSKADIDENINTVKEYFHKNNKYYLKDIIPVVALEYKIDDSISVEPFGLEELCLKTLECKDEAKLISKDNKEKMVLNQKRFTAQGIITAASAAAVGIALVPLPSLITDSTLLIPLEVKLTKSIFKVYDVKYSEGIIDKVVGGVAITLVAKQIVQAIPLVGIVANAVVAGTVVFALGEAITATSELIYCGKLDPEKIDEVIDTINSKLKGSAIIGAAAIYYDSNKDKIKDKNPKEIINGIIKSYKQ